MLSSSVWVCYAFQLQSFILSFLSQCVLSKGPPKGPLRLCGISEELSLKKVQCRTYQHQSNGSDHAQQTVRPPPTKKLFAYFILEPQVMYWASTIGKFIFQTLEESPTASTAQSRSFPLSGTVAESTYTKRDTTI